MRTLGIRTVGLAALSVMLAASAQAAPIYGTSAEGELVGVRTEFLLFEITTGGNYASDGKTLTLNWVITEDDPSAGVWRYQYTFSMYDAPAISHFILDLTDDCIDAANQESCVRDTSPSGATVFGTFGPSSGNPGFPEGQSITGIKFEYGTSDPFTLVFFSDRAPVYGDFYIKGGNDSFAFNTGLTDGLRTSSLATLFIARPNGADDVTIPEPASMLLIGTGLAGLAVARRRRKGV